MSVAQDANKGSLVLSLIPLKPHLHYSIITNDFNPPANCNKSSNSIIPKFLKDGRYYTPAFIIPIQSIYYNNCFEFQRLKFQERVFKNNWQQQDLMNSFENQIEILVPKPESNYCQVCNDFFKIYDDHIQQSKHLRQTHYCKASTYIGQMCKKYNRRIRPENTRKKRQIGKLKKQISDKNTCKQKKKKRQNEQGNKNQMLSTNMESFEGNQQ